MAENRRHDVVTDESELQRLLATDLDGGLRRMTTFLVPYVEQAKAKLPGLSSQLIERVGAILQLRKDVWARCAPQPAANSDSTHGVTNTHRRAGDESPPSTRDPTPADLR